MNIAPIGKRRSIDVPINTPCAFWYVGISPKSLEKPPKLLPPREPNPDGLPDEPPEPPEFPSPEMKGFESEERYAAVRSKVNWNMVSKLCIWRVNDSSMLVMEPVG